MSEDKQPELQKIDEPYSVQEEICGCHYSIRLGKQVVISSWNFADKSQADLVCDELNRAWENGKNEKKSG